MCLASDPSTRTTSPPRALVWLWRSGRWGFAAGCTTHYVVPNTKPALVEKLKLNSDAPASDRTMQVLRQSDLTTELHGNPRKLLADLQAIIDREPSAEKLYAVAELKLLPDIT